MEPNKLPEYSLNQQLVEKDNKREPVCYATLEEGQGLTNGLELVKSVSDKHLDLLRPSARYHSLFKALYLGNLSYLNISCIIFPDFSKQDIHLKDINVLSGQTTDAVDHEKGKYTLIRDSDDFQPGAFDKPLPCFGCGIGWFSFLFGFVFPLMWYYATILYFGNYYRKDPRERAGLAASAVAALACSLVLLIIVMVHLI